MSYITNIISAIVISITALASGMTGSGVPVHENEHAPLAPHHAEIIFAGDMQFDRTIRTAARVHGGDFLFSCLDPLFSTADLVVANLEGPITEFPSTSEYSKPADSHNYTFTFPTTTAKLLAAHHVSVVNIGNNHILNYGWEGERSTREYLARAGVGYFGDPTNQTVVYRDIASTSLAFINYNEFAPRGFGSVSTTTSQIALARLNGYLPIVYTHWGEEYEPATAYEKSLAHAFIDAGAEMVVGSHPHIVQEHEVYKGKYIYYSLGNLIFDQYWDDAVMHGLVLRVSFTPEGVASIQEIPVELRHDRRTCPLHK